MAMFLACPDSVDLIPLPCVDASGNSRNSLPVLTICCLSNQLQHVWLLYATFLLLLQIKTSSMAFAGSQPAPLIDRQTPQPVTSHLGHHFHSHSTVRPHAAHQCRLEQQCRRSSRAIWSTSMAASRQRQNPRQKRGHSAIVYADQDYYSVLGISKNADKAAIKSAYRQKARKFHPDVNKEPGAEDTFKAVSNAYEVLSDDQKRGIYDR